MAKSERPRSTGRPSANPPEPYKEPDLGPGWKEYCRTPVSPETRELALIAEIANEVSFLVKVNAEGRLAVDVEKSGLLAKVVSREFVNSRDYEAIKEATRRQIMDVLSILIQGMIDEQKEQLEPGVLEGTVTEAGLKFLGVATGKDGNGGGRSYYVPRDDRSKGIVIGNAVLIRPGEIEGGCQDGPKGSAYFVGIAPDYAKMAANAFASK